MRFGGRQFLLQFAKEHNLIQKKQLNHPQLIFAFCYMVQSLQILSILLPLQYDKGNLILLIPELLISLTSVRAWKGYTQIELPYFLGFFLFVNLSLLVATIAAIITFSCSKKLGRLYVLIVEYDFAYFYYSLMVIPSLELGLIFLLKNFEMTLSFCKTSTCQTAMAVLGGLVIGFAFLNVMYYELIKVSYRYQETGIATRFSSKRYFMRLVCSAVLGSCSIYSSNSTTSMLVCSLVWCAVVLFEIGFSCFIFPQYTEMYANEIAIILQVLSIYIVVERVMDDWRSSALSFPTPVLMLIIITLLLAFQRRNLAKCWSNLSTKNDTRLSLFQKDRCLRVLIYEFTNYKHYNYQFMEMIQPILHYMDEINQAIQMQIIRGELEDGIELLQLPLFNSRTRIDPSNVYFSEISKKSLFQTIKHIYLQTLSTQRTKTPLWLMCSYISFTNSIVKDNLQTMFAISRARKEFSGQLTFYTQLSFLLFESNVEESLQNAANAFSQKVENICSYSKKFEGCVKSVDKVVQVKAAFYMRFLDAAINLRTIKNDSRYLFKKSVQVAEEIERLLESSHIHIETHLLYQFYVKDILDDVNRYSQKVSINTRMRIKQIVDESQSSHQLEITNSILWNLDNHRNIFFIVIGMNPLNKGQLLAFSKNIPKLLKSEEGILLGSKIRDFMAPFQANVVEDLVLQLYQDSQDRPRIIKTMDLFIRRANEGLMHFNAEIQIELFNGEPSIVLYMARSDHRELEFFIFDASRKILGYSTKLLKCLRGGQAARSFALGTYNGATAEEVIPDLSALFVDGSVSTEQKDGVTLNNPFFDGTEKSEGIPVNMRISYLTKSIKDSIARDYIIKVILLKTKKLEPVQTYIPTVVSSAKNIQDREQTFSSRSKSTIIIHASVVRKFKGLMSFYNRIDLEEKAKGSSILPNERRNSDSSSVNSSVVRGLAPKSGQRLSLFSNIARKFERVGSLDNLSLNDSHKSQEKSEHEGSNNKINRLGSDTEFNDQNTKSQERVSIRFQNRKAISVNETLSHQTAHDLRSKGLNSLRLYRSLVFNSEGTGRSKKVLLTIYQLKEIINRGETPLLVFQANIFGFLLFLLLCGMIIGAFFLLKNLYFELSQKAYTINFPEIVSEITASAAAIDEMGILLQAGLINNSTRTSELLLLSSNDSIAAFDKLVSWQNTYTSNSNIGSVLGAAQEFSLDIIRSSYEKTQQTYTFEQMTELLQGVLYILSQTNIMNITAKSSEVEFLRHYDWDYIDMADSLRDKISTEFNQNVDSISLVYRIIVGVLTSTCFLAFILFLPIFKRVQVHETQILSKLCTLSNEELNEYLQKFQSIYMQYFKKPLTLGLSQNSKDKGSTKSQTRNLKRFVFKSYNILVHVTSFLIIGLSIFIFSYVYAQFMIQKTETSTAFVNDINFLSITKSTLGGIFATILYEINTGNVLEQYNSQYDQYGITNDNLITTLQSVQQRILDNSITTNLLKAQYQNLSSSLFCNSSENAIEADYCVSSFKAASKIGLTGLYSGVYTYILAIRASLNASNSSTIVDTEDFVGLVADEKIMEHVLQQTAKIEGDFLYAYCQSLEYQTIWFVTAGLLLTIALFGIFWGRAYQSIRTQFMEVRYIFSQLPSELIANNTHIKNMLKRSGKSLI